jgi:GAF domain-containing protein
LHPHLSLAAALTQAATAIHTPRSLTETLTAIVEAARTAVPGFDHAGLSVRHPDGSIETLAGTDQLVWDLDAAQYQAEEGPCLDAIHQGTIVVVEHVRTERRWPTYLPAAIELGLCAQMGVVLQVDGKSYGGLNLYSTRAGRIDREAVHIAQLFATHAATALGWARHDEQLGEALSSRKVIGQAIGIAMERYGIDEDRAFHFLLRTSSTSNTKLREVAQRLVDEGNTKGTTADLEAI